MSRSPLFYPMHRGDTDAGGAADLQTDIMRFMAILALCLVAIFALVQSIPLVPEAPTRSPAAAAPPPPTAAVETEPEPPVKNDSSAPPKPEPERAVRLTRPKWTSTVVPTRDTREREAQPEPLPAPQQDTPAPPPERGFTLRFESDIALTRLVAAGKVGLYAIAEGRARRMTVSESRISFWDASAPNSYHEMETSTVPGPVIDALARTGTDTARVGWGVTLPGKLREQLDALMRGNAGGALVIGQDGELRLEAS
ncbi:MAG: hypothetical protein GWP60_05150 [Gammaproteobacteria bacterium]|nr:hypothetical protein [Gammaproteobacteria bacterium]